MRRNSSQRYDGVSCNLYPAAGNRVTRRMESALSCIESAELESAEAWSEL